MKISFTKNSVIISHKGDEVTILGVQRPRKNNGDKSPEGQIFGELNKYWTTLPEEATDEMFEAYKALEELATESVEVINANIHQIAEVIGKWHQPEDIKKIYPIERVIIPDNIRDNYNEMSPNFTAGMTYIRSDYYDLLILSVAVKAFVPLFGTMGTYVCGKGVSQEARRTSVFKITQAVELLLDTNVLAGQTLDKLRDFMRTVEAKSKNEAKAVGGPGFTVLAAVFGYGSDTIEDYLLGVAVVNVIARYNYSIELTEVFNETPDSIVSKIFYAISSEVKEKFASKLTSNRISLKPHPTTVVTSGESSKGKVGAIDLVMGRSRAPVKESVRTAVAFHDYRGFIKFAGIEMAPAKVKVLIDGQLAYRDRPIHELHNWLVSAAVHRFADRRTLRDVDPEDFMYGMALAQAIYIQYGFYNIAQILSCDLEAGNICGHPLDPIESEVKVNGDRYYPQGFRVGRSLEQQSVLKTSVELLSINHISPYFMNLRTTPEAAEILRCESEVVGLRLASNLLTSITEFLSIQARLKLNEVQENKEFYR